MTDTDAQIQPFGEAAASSAGERRRWYVWDIVLLGLLFLFGTFANAFPLLFYWGGLHNSKSVPFAASLWLVLLVPLAGICLLAALARIVVCWPRRIAGRRKLLVLQIATTAVTLAYVGLPFTNLGPSAHQMHLWGMRKYVQTQVDIAAIRAWLGTLDPNTHDGVHIDIRRDEDWQQRPEPNDPALPPCVLSLEPRFVRLASVGNQSLAVGMEWGGGLVGSWGLTTGPPSMGTPPSTALSRWPDYSLDVSPGVRIWHGFE
jgi:hypothetical protein